MRTFMSINICFFLVFVDRFNIMKIQEDCKEIRKIRQQIKSINDEIKRDKMKYRKVSKLLKENLKDFTAEAVLCQEKNRDYCYKNIYALRQLLCIYPLYQKILSYII
jgi:hypothetical protein